MARIEGPFVVFIIGMRINRILAVHECACGNVPRMGLGMRGEPAVASYDNPP